MYGFIYQTTNKLNSKRYIGLCTHENPIVLEGKKQYLGSGTIIKNAIKRYGRSNFTREILEICFSKEDLDLAEIKWIEKLKPDYNITPGDAGGHSKILKEYWGAMSEQERKTARNWGRKTSVAGENNPMYGKHTSETVQRTWAARDDEYRKGFGKKISNTKKSLGLGKGSSNPMYGRSAIKEKNLKWYTNGIENKYITEGTEPYGWKRGRTNLSGNIGKRKQ